MRYHILQFVSHMGAYGVKRSFLRRSVVKTYGQNDESWAIDTAKRGHPAGLSFLYELHKNYVFSLCLRMTRQPALAEDLTQDVFLHLGRKIHLYRGAAKFRSWLHRITVNMVAMYFRRHKQVDVSLDNDNTAFVTFALPAPSGGLDLDTRILLTEALSCLPAHRRRVLLLHDLEGYRHKEISTLLGITQGASRCQLHHARLKLRAKLGVKSQAKRIKPMPALMLAGGGQLPQTCN
jgi:RNA polymerase sigma-70 factor, ECF subfamily